MARPERCAEILGDGRAVGGGVVRGRGWRGGRGAERVLTLRLGGWDAKPLHDTLRERERRRQLFNRRVSKVTLAKKSNVR